MVFLNTDSTLENKVYQNDVKAMTSESYAYGNPTVGPHYNQDQKLT